MSRFSSKLQHSTSGQVRDCTEFAATHKIYIPPEYVCVDEGITGRKSRRDGLERMKLILQHKLADVLLALIDEIGVVLKRLRQCAHERSLVVLGHNGW